MRGTKSICTLNLACDLRRERTTINLTTISIEHLVTYIYTQNGLAKSFIKHLQLIARPLLMRAKLPTFVWKLHLSERGKLTRHADL